MADEISSSFVASGVKPLFDVPIPVVIVSGPHGSGKTLLGVSLCPSELCLFDEEDSAASYEKPMGIKKRISMSRELLQKFPQGHRPIDIFEMFLEKIRQIKPGEYRVLMVDPVSEIEQGLADWVRSHPKYFGATAEQYNRMAGLMWGHVKSYWKQLLLELSAKTEVVYLTAHLRNEWSGTQTTGRKIPKGLETLEELASLYLILNRAPDRQTSKVPDKPRAQVKKSRLAALKYNAATGDLEPMPILPPNMEECTWRTIREYIAKNGIDYNKLKKGEQHQEEKLSAEDKLRLELEIANRNAEAENAKLAYQEQVNRNKEAAKKEMEERRAALTGDMKTATVAASGLTPVPLKDCLPELPPDEPVPAQKTQAPPATPPSSHLPAPAPSAESLATKPQIEQIVAVKAKLISMGWSDEKYKQALTHRNVASARQLTEENAGIFITKLNELLDRLEKERSSSTNGEVQAEAAAKS